MALSVVGASPLAMMKKRQSLQGCDDPGDGQCAVLTTASLTGMPEGPYGTAWVGTSGGGGVSVVNGNCSSIVSGGSVGTDSPGFSGDLQTIYGTTVYYGAQSIGLGFIDGITFQYNGASYTQSDCYTIDMSSFGQGSQTVECPFSC